MCRGGEPNADRPIPFRLASSIGELSGWWKRLGQMPRPHLGRRPMAIEQGVVSLGRKPEPILPE